MIHRKLCVLLLLLGALATVSPKTSIAAAADPPLVVVAAKSFPADSISFAALKSAFRGQRVQVAGKTVVPINHPLETPTRVVFDQIALGLKPEMVGPFWVDLRIRDQGRPPTTASTPELALRIASALMGAVTYSTPSALGKWPLKILTIDGKSAGQHGYPLNR